MKKLILLAGMFAMFLMLSAQTVRTCREIQEPTAANGNSPYAGQSVTVQGIVTAERYYTGSSTSNYGFMISDPGGGPWSGLFIFTNQHTPSLGDLVEVTGTILEYFEFTEMSPVNSFQVISQGNPLPEPALITTGQLIDASSNEQWESCYVKVLNTTVTGSPNSYQEFYVTDGSGAAQVDNQCFAPGHTWSGISVGQTWAEIRGVVDFSFSYFGINPRSATDMIQEYTLANSNIRLQSAPNAAIDNVEKLFVYTSRLRPNFGVESYSMVLKFDPSLVKFEGVDIDSTLTLSVSDSLWTLSEDESTLTIRYYAYESGDYQGPMTSPADDAKLIALKFRPLKFGDALIRIDEFKYNNTLIQNLIHGTVTVKVNKRMAFLDIHNFSDNSTQKQKNIFNPQLNEKIRIRYGYQVTAFGINAKAIIRIYDAQGRLVATPVNKNMSTANGIEYYDWNGRDTNMNLLPIGLYYCHFEIIERNTGHREQTVQPIVIRSILK